MGSNKTVFRPKDVTAMKFGETALTEADLAATGTSLEAAFDARNSTVIVDLVGAEDSENPVESYFFARSFQETGNEVQTTSENFLGSDSTGSRNSVVISESNSATECEVTIAYINPVPETVFSDRTKSVLIKMDNSESSTTGKLTMIYNNITVTQVGNIQRGTDGLMEQTVRWTCAGGTSGTGITVSDSPDTFYRVRKGSNMATEIQTA